MTSCERSSACDPDLLHLISRIGIFDSGIGGLTIARAIADTFPGIPFVYFGDTAHLPYGEKSPELIRHYASRISHHLLDWGADAIVVACNSASSNALMAVRDAVGPEVPVIDVISPVVQAVTARQEHFKGPRPLRVGVIGTRATIEAEVYQMALANAGVDVVARATPLLASAVEEGFASGRVSEALLEAYLGDGRFDEIDLFIMGCTHYPLIAQQIRAFLPPHAEVLDTPQLVADELRAVCSLEGATSPPSSQAHQFYVSDLTEAFTSGARRFFGEAIALTSQAIWRHGSD